MIGLESPEDGSFWEKQYTNDNFKNDHGESFHEVRVRMKSVIYDIYIKVYRWRSDRNFISRL